MAILKTDFRVFLSPDSAKAFYTMIKCDVQWTWSWCQKPLVSDTSTNLCRSAWSWQLWVGTHWIWNILDGLRNFLTLSPLPTRQGTSSKYQNSYLDLAVSLFVDILVFVNSTKISTNSETAMLSIANKYQISTLATMTSDALKTWAILLFANSHCEDHVLMLNKREHDLHSNCYQKLRKDLLWTTKCSTWERIMFCFHCSFNQMLFFSMTAFIS